MWTNSSARAQLTRSRIPRLMKTRSSGSCTYEPQRGRQYWTDFTVNGRRYRKRLGTTNLRVATRRERELIEEAGHGRLPVDEQGPKRLSEAIDAYLTAKRIATNDRTRGGAA